MCTECVRIGSVLGVVAVLSEYTGHIALNDSTLLNPSSTQHCVLYISLITADLSVFYKSMEISVSINNTKMHHFSSKVGP